MKTPHKGILVIFVGLIWAFAFVYLLVASMPYNPMSHDDIHLQNEVRSILPEGWGFFTRNPREIELRLFVKKDGQWYKHKSFPYSSIVNFFGLSRSPRAISLEIPMLINKTSNIDWKACDGKIEECINTSKELVHLEVKQEFDGAQLCDTICIVKTAPIPWAWSKNKSNFHMASEFLIIKPDCNNE